MISISIISVLIGATLAQRLKVMALAPAMVIVVTLAALAQGTPALSVWWFVKMAVTVAVCLQCGFFAGIIMRQLVAEEPSEASSQLSRAETTARHAARN